MFRTIAPWIVGALVTAPICACDKPGATEMQQEQQAREQAGRAASEAQQSQEKEQALAQQRIESARVDLGWDAAKARVDREWAALDDAVRKTQA